MEMQEFLDFHSFKPSAPSAMAGLFYILSLEYSRGRSYLSQSSLRLFWKPLTRAKALSASIFLPASSATMAVRFQLLMLLSSCLCLWEAS